MLLRLLTARTGSREEAEDVLQDMWLRIDRLATGPVAQPAALLFRIAANLATDHRIAARRRGARDHGWQAVQPGADEVPDAERVLAARSELALVERAIADMPERMATALRLFRLDGVPQRAIADQLGISISGVEKLLQRAYRLIRERLAAGESMAGAGLPAPRRLDIEGTNDRAE